jgi:hypothetical protein
MRRLILATGQTITDWCGRLRRSADWLSSLSAAQAGIVAEQATAIASDPDDVGSPAEMEAALEEISAVPEPERTAYLSRQIIAIRNIHYPGKPDGD